MKVFRLLAVAALIGLAAVGTMLRASAATVTIAVSFDSNFHFTETNPASIDLGSGTALNLAYGNIYNFVVNTPFINPLFFSTDISATRNAESPNAADAYPELWGPVHTTNGGTITIDATGPTIFPTLSYMDSVHGAIFSNFVSFSSPQVTATPLPAALPLFATGLAGLGWFARRRRKQAA